MRRETPVWIEIWLKHCAPHWKYIHQFLHIFNFWWHSNELNSFIAASVSIISEKKTNNSADWRPFFLARLLSERKICLISLMVETANQNTPINRPSILATVINWYPVMVYSTIAANKYPIGFFQSNGNLWNWKKECFPLCFGSLFIYLIIPHWIWQIEWIVFQAEKEVNDEADNDLR